MINVVTFMDICLFIVLAALVLHKLISTLNNDILSSFLKKFLLGPGVRGSVPPTFI